MSVSGNAVYENLVPFLEETFDSHHGIYLDKGDNLFSTLAEISHEQASIPVGSRCAALSAQVKHTAFYIQVMLGEFAGEPLKDIDWNDIWETVSTVNADEWAGIVAELKSEYQRVRDTIQAVDDWSGGDRFGIVIAIIAHSAYHLGEIRQALCTLRR
jgi:hypothetical protein